MKFLAIILLFINSINLYSVSKIKEIKKDSITIKTNISDINQEKAIDVKIKSIEKVLFETKKELLKIKKENKSEKFDWNNILAALLGGFIGLLPSIINFFKKAEIKGKILSQYSNQIKTQLDDKTKIVFLHKLSIFVENKNFSLKDVEINIKFPSTSEIKCQNWIWRDLKFLFNDNIVGNNIQKRLNIEQKEYLLHFTILPKEQSIVGYFSFTIDQIIDEKLEYIKYIFKDYKGNNIELKINQDEISENTQLFDDSIWI